jgi:predicted ATPase/DNA-binding SARP family transcriptional activator
VAFRARQWRSVEIRVLGPVEVVGRGGAIRLAGQQRRLLAALVVAGGPSSTDALIEAIWSGTPPPSAAKLVQVYVSKLRGALGDSLRIETRGTSYAVLDPSVDAAQFERLLADGAAERRKGNPELALSLVARALALWRGPAYGEFAYEDFARVEAERLEELRIVAAEERFEAGLALGRHADLLSELRATAEAHPLREHLQAQAMLALYRCGRQTDALELYSQAWARLRDELGLQPGRELRELQRQILEQDPSLDAARVERPSELRLPVPPNPLLGRDRELTEVGELVQRDDVRLIALTGAGGSGKTRLALEAAQRAETSFANGAAWVELAPLRDPVLLVEAIVAALAVDRVQGDAPLDALTAFLRPRELLLVLDNAEHLHEATPVLSELLASAPRLTLLVTSRTVLHLSGEHVYPVQPLEAEPAGELFHVRARQADARFDPNAADQDAIRQICARLDGLPLAIELAAARTPTVQPAELLGRLDASLPLLTGGPRDLPARQQTLRATLAWSFDLLPEPERDLAARLSVFVGSFDLEAATHVAEANLNGLTRLIEQSLLQQTGGGGFRYLETVREYALDLFRDLVDVEAIRRRHFSHFLRLAEDADLSAVRRRGGERLDLAAAARDNLRAALAWSLETGSIVLGLELAIAMERYWVTHDPREGMRWFNALLRSPAAGEVDAAVRANALRAYGGATDIAGDADEARKLWEQSLELFQELGDEHGSAVLLHRLGISALRRGDLAEARSLVETSQHIHERKGDRWGQAQAIATLGAIARDAGDPDRAFELISTGALMAREAGVRWWESGTLAELASLALKAGQIDEAERYARESLTLADQIGDRGGRVFGVGLFAGIAASRGQRDLAQELWAAVAGEDAGAPLGGWRRHRREIDLHVTRHVGHAPQPVRVLGLEEAVATALRSTHPEREIRTRRGETADPDLRGRQ